jgi:hypothetical protein
VHGIWARDVPLEAAPVATKAKFDFEVAPMGRTQGIDISASIIGPDWISQHQLAAQLNKSLYTLQRWRRARLSPPFIKLGYDVYYRKRDIDKWVEARLTTTPVRAPRIEIVPQQRNARSRNARRTAK